MNRLRIATWWVLVLAIGLAATAAPAGEIHLTLDYIGSLSSEFEDIGFPLYDLPPTLVPSDYHGFDIYMELAGLGPGEDFQMVQFDINLDPRFVPADFGGWVADTSLMYDPSGPPPPVPVFPLNVDSGTDPNDLKRVIVFTSSAAVAAAVQPGESGPVWLGTAYIQWTGNTEPFFGGPLLQIVDNPPGGDSWSLWVNGVGVAQYSGFHGGQFANIMPIPEPSSITLAGLALVGLVAFIHRHRPS
jgi:hypothetical protein